MEIDEFKRKKYRKIEGIDLILHEKPPKNLDCRCDPIYLLFFYGNQLIQFLRKWFVKCSFLLRLEYHQESMCRNYHIELYFSTWNHWIFSAWILPLVTDGIDFWLFPTDFIFRTNFIHGYESIGTKWFGQETSQK